MDHLLEKLQSIKEIMTIFVVTNDKFYQDFLAWSYSKRNSQLRIINDGTKTNEDRLGSIGDIYLVIQQEKINQEDLLIICGDNLFEFPLVKFIDYFKNKQTSIVALQDLKDKEKVKNRFGVAILDKEKVIDFQEKPSEPKTTLASTGCYLFHKNDLFYIQNLVNNNIIDPPGLILKKLIEKSELQGFTFNEAWFDIGSLENLEEARNFYDTRIKKNLRELT